MCVCNSDIEVKTVYQDVEHLVLQEIIVPENKFVYRDFDNITTDADDIDVIFNENETEWIIDKHPVLSKPKNVSVFCAESQYGIVNQPSYGVTWAEGTYVDAATGIRRNSKGDYLCAMGTKFGYCGDRFEVALRLYSGEVRVFTVQIGDSKGDVWWHVYGQGTHLESYCIIEFIADMSVMSSAVYAAGGYHCLDEFKGDTIYIKKIAA